MQSNIVNTATFMRYRRTFSVCDYGEQDCLAGTSLSHIHKIKGNVQPGSTETEEHDLGGASA